jgi:hypothetical protein
MGALRLLSGGLAWAHTSHANTRMFPVFATITTIANPFEEKTCADAHLFYSPPQPAISVQLSVFLHDISARLPMSHALLMPEHVPLPLSDWWRRILYCHYVTLSLRQERLTLLTDPQSKQEKVVIQAALDSWGTWFSQQAHTNQISTVQEMYLSLLTAAIVRDAKTRQGLLSQIPTMSHFIFDEEEGFVCQRCALKSFSARAAYYHSLLAAAQEDTTL